MSVVIEIDTGRRRTFASLFGASPSIARESMAKKSIPRTIPKEAAANGPQR